MKIRLHLNIFIFIIIFILTRQIEIYGIIMIFSILHELGHIITGLILGFKPDTLEIMPFGLSIQFCSDAKNYNKKIKNGTLLNLKKIVIATSGPLVNMIFTIFFMFYPILIYSKKY